jgi:anti-anti-sigma factor
MSDAPGRRPGGRPPVAVIELSGDVDVTEAPRLRERLQEAVRNSDAALVVDLSEVTYIDSAGVNVLFELAEGLRERQIGLALVVREGGLVERVLALVDVAAVAEVHGGVEGAVASVQGTA